ncbi:hypothetical protein [Streptomyces sp. H27-C3]|uniref:hypothetical protein n=1 Tax=Streptomyces sp. H27-C3 TaxID=3046305 RepID=UPI0024BAB441|nr:hypothetical protein [Streptomyces sp. H27-C3]MDJ0465542.1 hypothetical protein [Streptomyces sp. H27-C3]
MLTKECEQAEPLVVGVRGVGGFTDSSLGSVARGTAEQASCPVFWFPAVGSKKQTPVYVLRRSPWESTLSARRTMPSASRSKRHNASRSACMR